MHTKIVPLILAGGQGKRLWPLSSRCRPKQFIRLQGGLTLLQQTLKRFTDRDAFESPFILTNSMYAEQVFSNAKEIGIEEPKLILEPISRDTGPAILNAVAILSRIFDQDIPFLAAPIDHWIEGDFSSQTKEVLEIVGKSGIISFGIKPTHTETEYGFIRPGCEYSSGINYVKDFIEKPSLQKASLLVEDCLWNSGIYLSYITTLFEQANIFCKEVHEKSIALADTISIRGENLKLPKRPLEGMPNISFDKMLIEKADKLFMAQAKFDWDDLGNWGGIWRKVRDGVISFPKWGEIATEGRLLTKCDQEKVDAPKRAITCKKGEESHIEVNIGVNIEEQTKPAFINTQKITLKPKQRIQLYIDLNERVYWILLQGNAILKEENKEWHNFYQGSVFAPEAKNYTVQNIHNDEKLIFLEVKYIIN